MGAIEDFSRGVMQSDLTSNSLGLGAVWRNTVGGQGQTMINISWKVIAVI